MMEGLFDTVSVELNTLVESISRVDPTYSVFQSLTVEEEIQSCEGSSYAFWVNVLENVSLKISSLWEKFVDEQIKFIEDTKVTLKKRSGILQFVRTFPVSLNISLFLFFFLISFFFFFTP